MAAPWFSALKLTAFRNYRTATLEPGPGPVVLVGPNGAGKTNLLEAVSLFTPGRGLRRAAYPDIGQAGSTVPWAVAATLETDLGPVKLGTGPKPNGGEASRIVRIDGATAPTIASLLDHVRILWLTPAMDGLFTGSAGDRRRFLDRLVLALDPDHGRRATAFEKAMRDRNRVLVDGVGDPRWLDALEVQMSAEGVALAAGRNTLIARLSALISAEVSARSDDPFPWAGLGLDGLLENHLDSETAVAVEDRYRAILNESRGRDRAAGRTLQGPHRSDLIVTHGPKNIAARLASTGEQKALLIGLVLAHARLVADILEERAPVVLLDEVAAHLDAARRTALFQRLIDLGGQAWMTGTDRDIFAPIGAQATVFSIDAGRVGSP